MTHEPCIGIAAMAFPGNHLGEERVYEKYEEMKNTLKQNQEARWLPGDYIAMSRQEVQQIGKELHTGNPDAILVVLTTFVPDYFLVDLIDRCDVPVFLWAVDKEIGALTLVGGVLVTGALHSLHKQYTLEVADIGDTDTEQKLLKFARAAMLYGRMKNMAIGVSAGKNNIMMSMAWDEFAVKRTLGINLENIPIEEFYQTASLVPECEVEDYWEKIRGQIGLCDVEKIDGLLASRYYLAARRLTEHYSLAGYSINCFPELKSQICLAVARLNDDLIAAGCEGDLHSTIVMCLLEHLAGKAAFNGDFLKLYKEENAILFSHCGAGAFSLAKDRSEVMLRKSIETCDGCAICYATYARGSYTIANLMNKEDGMHLYVLNGDAVHTDLEYEGTPLKIAFLRDVSGILKDVVRQGAGHHWSGVQGDYRKELEILCGFTGMEFHDLTVESC